MKNGLYHKKVYLPKIQLSEKLIKLNYTIHAIEAAESDPRGVVSIESYIRPSDFDLIEMEVNNNKIIKLVLRKNYDDNNDITIVIATESHNVKTLWLNDKNDLHETLNIARYVPAP